MATIHSAHNSSPPQRSHVGAVQQSDAIAPPENIVDAGCQSQSSAAITDHKSIGDSPGHSMNVEGQAAAVLDLATQVARRESLSAASRILVERLAEHLKLEQVALAWRRSVGGCSLLAISGLTQFDRRSETVELLQSVADEATSRQADGFWPPLSTTNRHALLAHRRLVEITRVEAVATFLLRSSNALFDDETKTESSGRVLGVLIVSGSRVAVHDSANIRVLTTTAECLTPALELIARAEGGVWRRQWTRMRRTFHRRALRVVMACGAAVTAILAMPLPYRVSCRCVIEPMQRRFVVAPFDGLIEASLVRPGDVVRVGHPLARMDGREVRWELAGLEADRRQAQQQRDSSLAHAELAKAELARLELEQIDAKLELLCRRQSLLVLQAPLDGVVLSGSIDRLSSVPVKTGQSLFEIAPLDRLRVEVSLPAEDYRHVRAGDHVELRFDGRASELQAGELARIRPRSEIRDSADVFVAEVELPNPDEALRPGQRGQAVVVTRPHPIAWNLFHKAYERVRQWWPW